MKTALKRVFTIFQALIFVSSFMLYNNEFFAQSDKAVQKIADKKRLYLIMLCQNHQHQLFQ